MVAPSLEDSSLPLANEIPPDALATLVGWFWASVHRCPNGCWEWQRERSRRGGYGMVRYKTGGRVKWTGAHRIAYQLCIEPVTRDVCVLHICDNPPCVRPDHLFVGSRGDNNRDTAAKGRHRSKGLCGSSAPCARLTEGQVIEMRQRYCSGESASAIARDMGVTPQHAARVCAGLSWRHLPMSAPPTGAARRERGAA